MHVLSSSGLSEQQLVALAWSRPHVLGCPMDAPLIRLGSGTWQSQLQQLLPQCGRWHLLAHHREAALGDHICQGLTVHSKTLNYARVAPLRCGGTRTILAEAALYHTQIGTLGEYR